MSFHATHALIVLTCLERALSNMFHRWQRSMKQRCHLPHSSIGTQAGRSERSLQRTLPSLILFHFGGFLQDGVKPLFVNFRYLAFNCITSSQRDSSHNKLPKPDKESTCCNKFNNAVPLMAWHTYNIKSLKLYCYASQGVRIYKWCYASRDIVIEH